MDGYAKESFKPYDALKRARMETKSRAASAGDTEFAAGDKVSHSKFGPGMVIECSATVVTVAFDSVGVKKLAKGLAPLKKEQ